MKLLKFIFIAVILLFCSGFAYFSFVDVSVQQQETSKDIPIEQFFN